MGESDLSLVFSSRERIKLAMLLSALGHLLLRGVRPVPKEKPPLTHKQLKAYFSEAEHCRDLHDFAALILQLGLREGELAVLARSDVDFAYRFVHAARGSHHPRTIPMTKTAERILRRRLSSSKESVFGLGSKQNPPVYKLPNAIWMRHKAVCNKIGLTFRLYDLRRTFAAILERYDVPQPVFSALYGYYVAPNSRRVVSEEEKRQAMDIFERSLSKEIEATNSGAENDGVDSEGGKNSLVIKKGWLHSRHYIDGHECWQKLDLSDTKENRELARKLDLAARDEFIREIRYGVKRITPRPFSEVAADALKWIEQKPDLKPASVKGSVIAVVLMHFSARA